jgi:hypothetical protein
MKQDDFSDLFVPGTVTRIEPSATNNSKKKDDYSDLVATPSNKNVEKDDFSDLFVPGTVVKTQQNDKQKTVDFLKSAGQNLMAGVVGAERGLTAGLVKYPAAGLYALTNKGVSYDDALKAVDEYYKQKDENNPVSSAIGEVAGAVLPIGAGANVAQRVGQTAITAAKNSPTVVKTLSNLVAPATRIATGAGYGAVNASSQGGDASTGALFGGISAGLGEALGAGATVAKKVGEFAVLRPVLTQAQAAVNSTKEYLTKLGVDVSKMGDDVVHYLNLKQKVNPNLSAQDLIKEAEQASALKNTTLTKKASEVIKKVTANPVEKAEQNSVFRNLAGKNMTFADSKTLLTEGQGYTKKIGSVFTDTAKGALKYEAATHLLPVIGVPDDVAQTAGVAWGGASGLRALKTAGTQLLPSVSRAAEATQLRVPFTQTNIPFGGAGLQYRTLGDVTNTAAQAVGQTQAVPHFYTNNNNEDDDLTNRIRNTYVK